MKQSSYLEGACVFPLSSDIARSAQQILFGDPHLVEHGKPGRFQERVEGGLSVHTKQPSARTAHLPASHLNPHPEWKWWLPEGTYPLSKPFCPSFLPMSPTMTPGMGSKVFGSRICNHRGTSRSVNAFTGTLFV